MSGLSIDKEWRAEDDMRTLVEAEAIRKDPKRLAAARRKAKEKVEAIKTIEAPAKKK